MVTHNPIHVLGVAVMLGGLLVELVAFVILRQIGLRRSSSLAAHAIGFILFYLDVALIVVGKVLF